MAWAVKVLLGCSGLVGGACAVGIPVAMGGAGEISAVKPQLVITTCDEKDISDRTEVEFKSDKDRNVCWKWSDEQEHEKLKTVGEDYTNVFAAMWDKQEEDDQAWVVDAAGHWTQQCTASGIRSQSQWILKEQYLGLCGDNEGGKTKFLKREKKTQEGEENTGLKLWTCDNDCWTPEAKEEKSSSWRQVVFYKKKEEADLIKVK